MDRPDTDKTKLLSNGLKHGHRYNSVDPGSANSLARSIEVDRVQSKGTRISRRRNTVSLKERALDLLARREHSEYELFGKLSKHTNNQQALHLLMQQLIEEKLLCNKRFTESYLRNRVLNGIGPLKIRYEIQAKKIDDELFEQVVEECAIDWNKHIQTVYQKKYRNSAVANYKEWTKRACFLQTRGFTSEQIRSVLPEYD